MNDTAEPCQIALETCTDFRDVVQMIAAKKTIPVLGPWNNNLFLPEVAEEWLTRLEWYCMPTYLRIVFGLPIMEDNLRPDTSLVMLIANENGVPKYRNEHDVIDIKHGCMRQRLIRLEKYDLVVRGIRVGRQLWFQMAQVGDATSRFTESYVELNPILQGFGIGKLQVMDQELFGRYREECVHVAQMLNVATEFLYYRIQDNERGNCFVSYTQPLESRGKYDLPERCVWLERLLTEL